ncbi:tetratricopeptide repeat protein [Scytonema sp. UIC 10036]|uniref:tetratricopeptide repeat protein n=1 Tax=Scytonema sp. UIC 10036 TaxID=2304196 RepID=UPI0012DA5CDF|nr:tetratricopeptide repeat protein [Scytonema sp. UIC 10036]MUG98828.1 tetratricopeptide repeat protein [Scytonema sp. UIC 10036]
MNPKPPLPSNEIARLHALRQYQILDTPPEKVFDDFTFLAAQVCRTPVALISLLDGNRQWFKSKIGVTISETERDVAFCAYSILQQQPLVVRNALLDSRFAKNTLVTAEPNIRFYAGAPLITSEGFGIGTLCVIDFVPRDLSLEQVESLRLLSHQVVAQLELRRNAIALSRTLTQRQQATAQFRQQLEFIEIFYQRGEEKAKKGDYQGAIAEFNQFLRLNPRGFKAYYGRGLARQKLGDNKGAMADLDLYLQFYPNDSEAHYYRGLLRLELGDYQGAIADYSNVVQSNPENFTLENFGSINSELADRQQLLPNHTPSLGSNSRNFETDINIIPERKFSQFELSQRDSSSTTEISTHSLLLNYNDNNDNELYLTSKHSQYEIQDYVQPLDSNSELNQKYISQGNTCLEIENYQDDIDDFTQYLESSASDLDVYLKRANSRFKLKDYKGAIEEYTQFIKLSPNDAKAYFNRGNCRYEMEDYTGAVEDYNLSVSLNPNDAEAYIHRAHARSKLQDYRGAIEDYTYFLQMNPDDAKAYISRGNARSKLKDYSGAIEDYKKVWSRPIVQRSSLPSADNLHDL